MAGNFHWMLQSSPRRRRQLQIWPKPPGDDDFSHSYPPFSAKKATEIRQETCRERAQYSAPKKPSYQKLRILHVFHDRNQTRSTIYLVWKPQGIRRNRWNRLINILNVAGIVAETLQKYNISKKTISKTFFPLTYQKESHKCLLETFLFRHLNGYHKSVGV